MGTQPKETWEKSKMKLFTVLPLAALGQFGDPAQMAQMVLPMIKQFYNNMDHPAHMADFKEDDNGLFKTYFNFCDEAGYGILTKADDAACKERLESLIMDRVQNQYGYHIDEATMAQAEGMKAMMTSFGEQIFNELIDSNHDGQATLMEIEMNSYCKVRAYVPDLDELVKKTKRIIRKADMDHDKAYDDRELAKVMLDVANLMVKRGFN